MKTIQDVTNARMGMLTAAALNLFGMPFLLVLVWHDSHIARWPIYLSMATAIASIVMMAFDLLRRQDRILSWFPALFVINNVSVTFAFYSTSYLESSLPAAKFGVVASALIAPNFFCGITAIGLWVTCTLVPLFHLSETARYPLEPWSTVGFAVTSVLILGYRLRMYVLHREMLAKSWEVEATRRLAAEFLELRDLMNTPIQSIEIATVLLAKPNPQSDAILEELGRSTKKLMEISQSLKRYDHATEWKGDKA